MTTKCRQFIWIKSIVYLRLDLDGLNNNGLSAVIVYLCVYKICLQ